MTDQMTVDETRSSTSSGPSTGSWWSFRAVGFNGEVAETLADLVDRGIIRRILDLLMIRKEGGRVDRLCSS